MSEPVLVVHGVNTRDEPGFRSEVSDLNRRAGPGWHFLPVYWGDLAAETAGLGDTIPGWIAPRVRGDGEVPRPSPALLRALLTAEAGPERPLAPEAGRPTRSSGAGWELVADAAVGAAGAEGGMATRGAFGTRGPGVGDEEEIRAAIAEQWPKTAVLRQIDDPRLLAEIGRAIAEGLAHDQGEEPGGTALVRDGGGERIKEAVKGLLLGIDRAVGAVTAVLAGNFNSFLRSRLAPAIGRFLGDVFVYESHQSEIQARLRRALAGEEAGWGSAERPVKVIAHSLGGVIAFDAAAQEGPDRLWIGRFVTFGSQSAFFHVLRARDGLEPYRVGIPVALPASIGGWTNLWEALDPLAFLAAKVFRLRSGQAPVDVEVPHRESEGLWTHGSYWTDPLLVGEIRRAFRQATIVA